MKNLIDYKAEYDTLKTKRALKSKEALQAIKENGSALQYVQK